MKLISLYILFAGISTITNLLFQVPCFWILQGESTVYIALLSGTLAGLVTKYILDKKWIFNYQAYSTNDNMSRFSLYSIMGVFTTLIFWGMELGFHYFFNFDNAKYIGGILGLAFGYAIKYQLDKRYVFVARKAK